MVKHRVEETCEFGAAPTGGIPVINMTGRQFRIGDRGRIRASSGIPNRTNRSRSAQRALNRRAARLDRENKELKTSFFSSRGSSNPIGAGMGNRVRKFSFVIPVITLVAFGLIATLWLSTRAAQDSYELTVAKTQNQSLLDKRDGLKRTYESGDSAPELSDKAAQLGLVPASNAARLVVDDHGRVTVRGKPMPAAARALQSINPKYSDDSLRYINKSKVEDSSGLPNDEIPHTPHSAVPNTINIQTLDMATPATAQTPSTEVAVINVLPAAYAQNVNTTTPRLGETNIGAAVAKSQHRS